MTIPEGAANDTILEQLDKAALPNPESDSSPSDDPKVQHVWLLTHLDRWPPDANAPSVSQVFDHATVMWRFTLERTIVATVTINDGESISIESKELLFTAPASFLLDISFYNKVLQISVNGRLVAHPIERLPDLFDFTAKKNVFRDFSTLDAENLKAIEKRRVIIRPNNGAKYGEYTQKELYYSLKQNVRAIDEFIAKYNKHDTRFSWAAASLIGAIIWKEEKTPLLRYLAATIDLPLIIYDTPVDMQIPEFFEENDTFGVMCMMHFSPRLPCDVPIDLDVWLEHTGIFWGKKKHSRGQLLNLMRNKMGAHIDVAKDRFLSQLQKFKIDTAPDKLDAINQQLHQALISLNVLARRVLLYAKDYDGDQKLLRRVLSDYNTVRETLIRFQNFSEAQNINDEMLRLVNEYATERVDEERANFEYSKISLANEIGGDLNIIDKLNDYVKKYEGIDEAILGWANALLLLGRLYFDANKLLDAVIIARKLVTNPRLNDIADFSQTIEESRSFLRQFELQNNFNGKSNWHGAR